MSLSQREAARRADVSLFAIQKALTTGRLRAVEGRRVDDDSLEEWIAYREARGVGRGMLGPDADFDVPALSEAVAAQVGRDVKPADARKLADHYRALSNKLEYDLAAGEVVRIDVVARELTKQLAAVRTRLLAIPSEQAPAIHRCRTAAEVMDRLLGAITSALEGLTIDRESV